MPHSICLTFVFLYFIGLQRDADADIILQVGTLISRFTFTGAMERINMGLYSNK